MDRRNFFKIVSSVSAGAASIACTTNKTDALIPLLVPEHEIVPGEEQWRPSVCTACEAGCGVIVRVMRGERVIERKGEKFREPIACVKKIEGNPLDSVSGGRLCARGHAVLQSIYNPDRIRGPVRRQGTRGQAAFSSISWDEAIAGTAEKLAKVRGTDASRILFLTAGQQSSRALSIQKFLEALGAPQAVTCSLGSLALERKAAAVTFGWRGVPRYDLANARYALGVGADFLGGWVSPVYYARQYGHFRQGRPGLRGKLVQAESRMSLTAASADEWLPVRPGTEAQFLVAVARLLVDEKLTRNHDQFAFETAVLKTDLGELVRAAGISEKRLRRVVKELGESESPVVIAGASVVHTNSLDALIAANFVNVLLGNVGTAGGVFPPSAVESAVSDSVHVPDAIKRAQIVFLDGENPVYGYPRASGVADALGNAESVISFGGFVDDSSAYADLILPDHHGLESEFAVIPPVAGTSVAFTVTEPIVRPLYETRALTQTLTEIAKKMNVTFVAVSARDIAPAGSSWEDVVRQGGTWGGDPVSDAGLKPVLSELIWKEAGFSGAPERFPFYFQPYLSLQYHDGRDANLPWMQEMPDPASSAMWSLPVEIDPQTATKMKIDTGDWVRVESAHGKIEAQVYVHPAALPGVVSMAIGQGHSHYGRYASGSGVNPILILEPAMEASTNSLAFGGTRVQLARLEGRPASLTQFAPNDREQGPWGYR